MNIKLSNIFLFFIGILLIINLQLLNFGDFTQVYHYLTSAMSLLLGCICVLNKRIYSKIKAYCGFMNRWLILFVVFLLAEMLYGWAAGVYSFFTYLSRIYIYAWCSLYYPIVYIMVSKDGTKKLLKKICFWTVIALILKTFVWWMYNYNGRDIMHYLLYEFGEEWIRRGFQRIPSTCFSGVLFATALYVVFTTKKMKSKIIALLCIFLSVWYAEKVFASRAQIIAFGLAVCIPAVLTRDKLIRKIFIYISMFIMAALIISSSYFLEFISSMSLQSYSMGMRVRALRYFYDLFRDHILMGFLFLIHDTTIHGPSGNFYLSDMGILEFLFSMGIIGFLLFVIPLVRMVFDCFTSYNKNDKKYIFGLSLVTYTISISFMSNNIYDPRYLFAWPFIMAYFEILRVNYRRNADEQTKNVVGKISNKE